MNMCYINNAKSMIYKLAASYWPSLIVSDEHASKVFPLKDHFSFILRESGYLHLQATKPDTIGKHYNSMKLIQRAAGTTFLLMNF